MASIIRNLEVAHEYLGDSKNVDGAREVLADMIHLLNLGYHPYQDVMELLAVFKSVERIPKLEDLELFTPKGKELR